MKGSELKRLRKRLGLTQKELAAKVGVAVNTVKRWEWSLRAIPEPVSRLLGYIALGKPVKPTKQTE